MSLSILFLIITLVLLVISLLVVYNLFTKVTTYENVLEKILPIFNQVNEKINQADTALKRLDTTGGFESDDEIGFFFQTVKEIQQDLNKILNSSNE